MKSASGWKKLKNWINGRAADRDPLVVCVCGMHRSGTSTVSQILSRCGIYMGPDEVLRVAAPDNQDGFWEDGAFVKINDEILRHFFGGWDLPPDLDYGWEFAADPRLSDIRDRARKLIDERSGHRVWGWKDPRSSITLPFWKSLIPQLKVIICVRHPWEVAQSLNGRNNFSIPFGLTLWQTYQNRVMAATALADRLITHYDSYFADSQAEISRILNFLALRNGESPVNEASSICKNLMRNNRYDEGLSKDAIPQPIADLYKQLCREAGSVTE